MGEGDSCVVGGGSLESVGIRRLWSENGSIAICGGGEEVAELEVAVAADFLNANLRFGARLARVSSKFCLSDLSAFQHDNHAVSISSVHPRTRCMGPKRE